MLLGPPDGPSWRTSQVGALGAVLAHWSLTPLEPALISMPTGSGKTAVAMALPYLAAARRVLVIVPNVELRNQTLDAFSTNRNLRDIGALNSPGNPSVHALVGTPKDWSKLEKFDVIVAIPASLTSARQGAPNQPSEDFFDLVIVDEAHHAAAWTWKAVSEFFEDARVVLLTATPSRRDGKILPARLIFHYPLRKAIEDGTYKRVDTVSIAVDRNSDTSADELIASTAISLLNSPAYSTSKMLIRVSSVQRAITVQAIYKRLGLDADVIHSRKSPLEREKIATKWRTGVARALVAVNMMGEGVDIHDLRLLAYHDKHRSKEATIQIIGRLARTGHAGPQTSAVIFERDVEILSELRGAVGALYQEDASWSTLLPTLVDDPIGVQIQDHDYLAGFSSTPVSITLGAIRPRVRVNILETAPGSKYQPEFVSGKVPIVWDHGALIGGAVIIYSSLNSTADTLLLIAAKEKTPQWYQQESGLGYSSFSLHLLSWRPSADGKSPGLLMINSDDQRVANALRAQVDPGNHLTKANPASLQATFDVLDRRSVSSVGVRNTFFGTVGAPSYAIFGGTNVERGMREADTNSRALGHAMAQVQLGSERVTAGFATTNGKYWESRHLSLRQYDNFITDLAARFKAPDLRSTRPLLPEVARGEKTRSFSMGKVLLVEINWRLMGGGWITEGDWGFESLIVELDECVNRSDSVLPLKIVAGKSKLVVWRGDQQPDGSIREQSGSIVLTRSSGDRITFAELFEANPLSIYFLDGSTVHGSLTYRGQVVSNKLPPIPFATHWDWTSTDILKETKRNAGNSVHHLVESMLDRPLKKGLSRWVLCDDGAGEIADHIVIEVRQEKRPIVELWHSKAATGHTAGVRVKDLEVLTQQAIKSRRHFVDPLFWRELGERLSKENETKLQLVGGSSSKDELIRLCIGKAKVAGANYADMPPMVEGRIFLVQPGLSRKGLTEELKKSNRVGVGQVREFLTILHNSTQGLAAVKIICSE